MRKLTITCIDFDTWMQKAKSDPDHFEQMRQQRIEAEIQKAPEDIQERLRCYQWRIDQVRQQYESPMDSYQALERLLWEMVYNPGKLRDAMINLTEMNTQAAFKSNNIITFPR